MMTKTDAKFNKSVKAAALEMRKTQRIGSDEVKLAHGHRPNAKGRIKIGDATVAGVDRTPGGRRGAKTDSR